MEGREHERQSGDDWDDDDFSSQIFSLDLIEGKKKRSSSDGEELSSSFLFSSLPIFSIAKEQRSLAKNDLDATGAVSSQSQNQGGENSTDEFFVAQLAADDDDAERSKSDTDDANKAKDVETNKSGGLSQLTAADNSDSGKPIIADTNDTDKPKAVADTNDTDKPKPAVASDSVMPAASDAKSDTMAEALKKASVLLDGKESSLTILESINRDLTESKGVLYGANLERVRDNLKSLLAAEPALAKILEPLAKKIQIPQITGRSESIQTRLDSSDPAVRSKEIRSEIDRLLNTQNRTPADFVELDRLRKAFLQEMRDTKCAWNLVVKEADKIYDKETVDKQPLTDADKESLKNLNSESSKLRQQSEEQVKFLVKMLNAEAEATSFLSTRGGKSTEGIVFDAMKDRLEALQKTDPRWKSVELVKLSGGAVDDLGGDFLVLDKKTGNFILIDTTQQSADGERKVNLPVLRKAGLISSDPHAWSGQDAARRLDIQAQADEILGRLKDGKLTLNIFEVDIPVARHTTSKLNYKQRVAYIQSIEDPTTKAVEIRAFREELLEKQRGIRETLDMLQEQKRALREQKRGEKGDVRNAIDAKIGLIDGLIDHSQEKPLVAIQRRLEELDRITKDLPPDKQPLARERARPGSAYNVSAEAEPVKKAMVAVAEAKSILASDKPVTPQQIVKALETLMLVYGENSTQGDILRQLKNHVEAANQTGSEQVKPSGTIGSEKVTPTAPDRLNLPKALLNAESVSLFHSKVEYMAAILKDAPSDSGLRIQEAMSEFMSATGLKEPHLGKDNLEVEISKEAKSIEVEYSAKGKAVKRIDGKFVLAIDGKTEVNASEVETKFVVPEKLLKGVPGELSKALYVSLMEQTIRSGGDTASGDKAGIRDFVAKEMSKIIPHVPESGSTSNSGIEITKLPDPPQKLESLEISARGIKIGNVEREIEFVELWTERVKSLKEKLALEQQKGEKQRDDKKIQEMKVVIAYEEAMLAKLKLGSGPEFVEASKRAQEMIRDFKPSAAEIERLANERGPGGAVRGRLVAVTTLLNAFIALKAKGTF